MNTESTVTCTLREMKQNDNLIVALTVGSHRVKFIKGKS